MSKKTLSTKSTKSERSQLSQLKANEVSSLALGGMERSGMKP